MGVLGSKIGKGWCDIVSKELALPFGGSYACANFGENRSRNATVRVLADGQFIMLSKDDGSSPAELKQPIQSNPMRYDGRR